MTENSSISPGPVSDYLELDKKYDQLAFAKTAVVFPSLPSYSQLSNQAVSFGSLINVQLGFS
jgi:hypothetical protein